ncbi:iron-sulfur cluster biosynthesis family protein [Desemzia sp. RIT804]|uniref:iron-sulfur cluster biosynthesis family protein n=1 Tax=Desemzia sp. RIT 804 TaxID=2810209 RepID=UPI001951E002|nr:iron-sulfur cluster biosynthesis family protein [Desemzia sp. RIT 804]MBM6614646.1 iron-sulfur cluster biosynthesis family protein [Desemzia sp. RIT 804]
MYLTITDSAIERLDFIQEKHEGKIALSYNDVPGGYACGIRGTFSLKLVTSPKEELDTPINSSIGDIYTQSAHLDDLNENMKLDYKKNYNTLVLTSDSGIIDANLSVVDDNDTKLY